MMKLWSGVVGARLAFAFFLLERGPILWYRTGHVTVDTYGGRADFLWREAQGDALKWKEFEDS